MSTESSSENPKEENEVLELGVQPIDALMEEQGLMNTDLVRACDNQLSHKVVSKARKGRRLTKKAKLKVLKGYNAALVEKEISLKQYQVTDLFNY